MLCGISTSFPVLSPNRRQVAHALLTRPPLIRTRRFFTVRLECVMHAASVHPEPGSNSRANCIQTAVAVKIFCRACLALYTLLSMSRIRDRFEILFSKKFRDSLHKLCLYFNLLLFNCQWSARFSPLFSAVFWTAWLLYHNRSHLSRGFSKLF